MIKKWVFIFFVFSVDAFAFDYEQKMIEYQGGLISQLNNCGVSYNRDGIFSRGLNGVTSNLSSPQNTVIDFKKYGGGIVSVLDNGNVLYSPNGRSLDGGNETIKIGYVQITYPCSGRCYTPNTASIIGMAVQGEYIAVLTTKKLHIFNFVTIGPTLSPVAYDLSYTQPCNSRGCTPKTISPVMISAVDVNGGKFYIQFSDGNIKTVGTLGELSRSKDALKLLQASAPIIKQIVPYRTGVATLLDNSTIIYASDISSPLSGTTLYSQGAAKKVFSILGYGGYGSSAIFVNFKDGSTMYSPYGSNLSGGGDTVEVMTPIDIEAVKQSLIRQFEPFKQKLINSYGHIVVKTEFEAKLLNKGDSIVFSGSWAAGYDGSNIVAANAVDFSGKPVSVKVYDKGWDGIEYKWRGRGEQLGSIIHSNDYSQIGDSEIKFTSEKGCSIVGGVSQIGEFPNGFSIKLNIEPQSFYSMVTSQPGAPTDYRKKDFWINLLGVGKDFFFGDYGWNVWTFYTGDAGAFGTMMSYLQYKNNFDFGAVFTRYTQVTAKKYLPGFQSGKEEVEIATNYILRHKTGSYCIHPKGGSANPGVGTPLILNPFCSPFEERLLFTRLPNGSLMHVTSGLCVHPEGGTASQGRKLVLWNSCTDTQFPDDPLKNRLSFEFTNDGAILHKVSGLCVHPSGGATNPADGTELVLWAGCSEDRLKYLRY